MLLTPGLLHVWLTQVGETPGVTPKGEQPGAATNTVVLLAPTGFAQTVLNQVGETPTLGEQEETGVALGYVVPALLVTQVVVMNGVTPLVLVGTVQVLESTTALANVMVGVQVVLVKGEMVPGLAVHTGTQLTVSVGFEQVVAIQSGPVVAGVPTAHAAELVAGWLFGPTGLLQIVVIQLGPPVEVEPSVQVAMGVAATLLAGGKVQVVCT